MLVFRSRGMACVGYHQPSKSRKVDSTPASKKNGFPNPFRKSFTSLSLFKWRLAAMDGAHRDAFHFRHKYRVAQLESRLLE